jgi:hypothetical protein
MGDMFTENWDAFEEAVNEDKAKGEFTGPLTANSSEEEINEYFDKYGKYLTAPDLVGGTIDINLDFPDEYGGTYTVSTKIDESMLTEDTSDLISIDPISAELDEYGLKEKMVVDSYAIGATGFRVHGTWEDETDWNEYIKYCDDNGIESSGDLKIRAWDDLGNNYLLILANNPDGTFDADLYDLAHGLEQFSIQDGVNYCSEWADNMTTLTFAIEKCLWVTDENGNDIINSAEIVSDTVTINIPQ